MRILIIISSFSGNSGTGGHYYSAVSIANALSLEHSVEIVNIGEFCAPVVRDLYSRAGFCKMSEPFPALYRGRLSKLIERLNPEVVIAFDLLSTVLVRPVCAVRRLRLINVKPGGPIPPGYYPRDLTQIHFSKTDASWARERSLIGSEHICYIPNRVEAPLLDLPGTEALRSKLNIGPHDIVIARIGRVHERYRAAFFGAVNLAKALRAKGHRARLVAIGHNQDEALVTDIRRELSDQDVLITDPAVTERASRFLGLAQINVGVGRGFMEGCAVGHYMYAVGSAHDLPIRVTAQNIEKFFEHNFSTRARVTSHRQIETIGLDAIAESIKGGAVQCADSLTWFHEMFSTDRVPEFYGKAIKVAASGPAYWSRDAISGEAYLWGQGLRNWLRRYSKR